MRTSSETRGTCVECWTSTHLSHKVILSMASFAMDSEKKRRDRRLPDEQSWCFLSCIVGDGEQRSALTLGIG